MQTFLPYPSFFDSARCLDNKRLGKQRVEAKQILMALEFGPFQYEDVEGNFEHTGPSPWVSCTEDGFNANLGRGRYRRTPWYNHPAVKMWRDFYGAPATLSLALYAIEVCKEWRARGFKDSLLPWFESRAPRTDSPLLDCDDWCPPWLGDSAFHRSHQSNLVRKNPAHYRKFFPDVPDDLPYVWPIPLP